MTATRVSTISPIAADVDAGLSSDPKRLPPRLFYDAEGSALFEEITRLPEYYLTRTEAAILQANAAEIARLAGRNVTVIELAAGSAAKTRLLLAEIQRRQLRLVYVPVDVSPAALRAARETIAGALPEVRVQPVIGDLSQLDFLGRYRSPRLVLFIGSTIGNLEQSEAVGLLRRVAARLEDSDRLLLGTDLRKDPAILLPAYNDAQGVTARFNRNLLARINRELGGDFDLQSFAHVAVWNAPASRMEMYLRSQREQIVGIRDLRLQVRFARNEAIHTENSYKHTLTAVRTLLAESGFALEKTWTDHRGWYGVHLARTL
jgi:L-histidine N-alpha-methyltransferase